MLCISSFIYIYRIWGYNWYNCESIVIYPPIHFLQGYKTVINILNNFWQISNLQIRANKNNTCILYQELILHWYGNVVSSQPSCVAVGFGLLPSFFSAEECVTGALFLDYLL